MSARPASRFQTCTTVVDIKFTTLDLLKDGHAGGSHLNYMVQVWIYNQALGTTARF